MEHDLYDVYFDDEKVVTGCELDIAVILIRALVRAYNEQMKTIDTTSVSIRHSSIAITSMTDSAVSESKE